MKKRFGAVAVVSIILTGIIVYAATRPAPNAMPASTKTQGAAPALPPLGYIEHAQYYDIVANYPTTTPLLGDVGAKEDSAAVALMRNFIGDTVAQFKTDGSFEPDRKEKLEIVYLIASSLRTVSYIFTVYEDTLGAHGNTFFRTFTFDTKTGAVLSLADLFTPGAPYLETLSSISRTKLPDIIGDGADASFIENGTMPTDKNFENFFFDNKDFVVLFPPYQVAPYSSGPQTLRLKIATLANILRQEYLYR
ncbi:MAG: DUF3298 domain-containing protein [Patescibacteria group bacterium]|nr:DUF3298 domain-containing protein [Patescibacteria group bacterium]